MASPPSEEAPADEPPKRRSPRLVVLLIALGVICVMGVAVVLYFALKNP
jgi:flagellar basal body-associated protein FliL